MFGINHDFQHPFRAQPIAIHDPGLKPRTGIPVPVGDENPLQIGSATQQIVSAPVEGETTSPNGGLEPSSGLKPCETKTTHNRLLKGGRKLPNNHAI